MFSVFKDLVCGDENKDSEQMNKLTIHTDAGFFSFHYWQILNAVDKIKEATL